MAREERVTGTVIDSFNALNQMELPFEEGTGICRRAFQSLVEQCHPGAKELRRCMMNKWRHCFLAPIESASFGDTLYFLTWAFCHPTMSRARDQSLHKHCGK